MFVLYLTLMSTQPNIPDDYKQFNDFLDMEACEISGRAYKRLYETEDLNVTYYCSVPSEVLYEPKTDDQKETERSDS